MGIAELVTRTSKQTAVYWGNPVEDGEGGSSFDAAVEIQCRWESQSEIVKDQDGNELVSTARVYVLQDLDENGYLYLGTLDDLDSNPDEPRDVDGALRIILTDKIPALGSTTEFVRKVHLNRSVV